MPAEPRQQHLDLAVGAVLRLVDHDEAVVERPAAHIGDGRDLDRAVGHEGLQALPAQPVPQRVVERPQIGVQLLLHGAGQIAEALPRLHRRARQHDARDLPRLERLDCGGDRKIGLTGSRRSERQGQMAARHRLHQAFLADALRPDMAHEALVTLGVDRVPEAPLDRGQLVAVVVETHGCAGTAGTLCHRDLCR